MVFSHLFCIHFGLCSSSCALNLSTEAYSNYVHLYSKKIVGGSYPPGSASYVSIGLQVRFCSDYVHIYIYISDDCLLNIDY
jgi:hypothetical protein